MSGWLRAAALAPADAIPRSNDLWPEIGARLLCCTPRSHGLEYADWWNPGLAEPVCLVSGMAEVDGVTGRVERNEAAV